MQQQISVITLGSVDLARSRRFYVDGFGWTPVFENEEIIFYQMNGFMLGTFLKASMDKDMNRTGNLQAGGYALAHNVASREDVAPAMERLARHGGRIIRPADAPPHGGFRGYVTDPDDHAWEIAWNAAWTIDTNGFVTFGV
ncbi:VOC family protein [Hoeflea sp.]|uniref:VOC family protein n=1 Tax=Hoeflea sp. TaxID=1940281 RepID=UPI003BAEDFC3